MNLNQLAQIIAAKEGLKKNLSIAQIKEVIRITLQTLRNLKFSEVISLLNRQK